MPITLAKPIIVKATAPASYDSPSDVMNPGKCVVINVTWKPHTKKPQSNRIYPEFRRASLRTSRTLSSDSWKTLCPSLLKSLTSKTIKRTIIAEIIREKGHPDTPISVWLITGSSIGPKAPMVLTRATA